MAEADGAPPAQEGVQQEFPSQYDEDGMTSFDKVEADLRGAELRLVCQLPSGASEQLNVSHGQDVTYAKAQLAKRLEVPYESLQFFLDDKLMFDPLSFNDFPSIDPKKDVIIRVEIAQ
eukprot:gnl/TRDRNA2_/TRDRNA2_191075_c0_seq1.p2 gnl/TRDRNA2_/TRDRNA2_191075_c0~~gnl/TRDRNA2_/TRDRNA2_191075_c0_seq1.p2  ORF type:complete len:118 (-),score=38.97 gnl/TRDRNA2_/TRDRNA2_191075_c0_seq1:65-418(-)